MATTRTQEDLEPMRQCIVTRQSLDKGALIRFVIGPDQQVTPDVSNKLPGRGVWVECQRSVLAKAIAKKQFSGAFKQTVQMRPDLLELTQSLLRERALNALSFARKAGQSRIGYEKVLSAIRSGDAVAVLHAADASEDGIKKLKSEDDILVSKCFTRDELSTILGGENVVHAAVCGGRASKDFITQLRRFTGFVEESPL